MGRIVEENSKRRILLVVRWPVGGIRTFLCYVYSRFDPNRWHFTILAPEHAEIKTLAKDLGGLDINFVLTVSKPSVYSFGITILKHLVGHRYDLVHSHGFTSAICSTFSCLTLFKKHLVTSHDVLNTEQFVGVKGKLKRWLLGFVLGSSTRIHSVSQDAQENLLYFLPGLKKECCTVIPNGVEADRFLQATAQNFREGTENQNTFLIGFFGRFMSQKGFRYLVDALEFLSTNQTLPKRPLVLAFGGGGFVEREQRNIKSRGLESYFRFMPFEPNIAGSIKGVDVVVVPSLWEACPLLPMEVLVCGTPLIATDCIGLREVISGTPTKKVPVKDVEALAREIALVMSENCMVRFKNFSLEAARKYDVKQQVEGMHQLYKLLIGGTDY